MKLKIEEQNYQIEKSETKLRLLYNQEETVSIEDDGNGIWLCNGHKDVYLKYHEVEEMERLILEWRFNYETRD